MPNVSLVDGHIDGMTNYDRIRNMSVEEMAEIIDKYDLGISDKACYSHCEKTTGSKHKCPYEEQERDAHCVGCIVEWLKSEVDTK